MNRWMRLPLAALLCAAPMSCTSDHLFIPFDGPTLSSISLTSVVQGTTTTVSLTGTNFVANAITIAISGTGIAVSDVVVASATAASATVTVAADAALGQRTITVTTAGGASVARTFMVNPPVPTLAGLAPAAGAAGTVTVVTLTGTHFVPGATGVAVSGAGVIARNVSVASATSLTVEIVVEPGAALTDRTVTVSTTGGTSGTRPFTITPPPPTLTGVTPPTGVGGTAVTVTLTGTHFVAGAAVVVSEGGVTVSDVVVVNGTTITARFTIAAGAALGARAVSVTTPGGVTGTTAFTVVPPAPTVTAISPASGVQGTTVNVTIAGANFQTAGTAVTVTGIGVAVSNVTVVSATSITATFTLSATAPLGERIVTVITGGGATAPQLFGVRPPAPTLTDLTPTVGVQGTVVPVTLTGTNFVPGAQVTISGIGVVVSVISVNGPTSLSALFTIAGGAPMGARSVVVETTGGATEAQTFTILPPGPTLASVTPGTGVQGTTVNVTLAGTSFVAGATTVAVSGAGVTVSNVNVAGGTTLTADLTVAAGAALGARNVTVTTAGGTTGAQTFTVNPPTPTLTSVAPNIGVQGTTVNVTLTGTSFVAGATTVAVSGANVTVSNVNVTNSTTLTADFTIGAGAALGTRNVTVTTAGGTSGTQTFTVNPPTPTLTSVAPSIGVQGTTVPVTLTGTNFVAGATTVAVSGANVTVSNVNVTNSTTLTADFTIGAGAALGARNVTVTTAGGTSGAQTFTVNPPAPTLTSVTPSIGVQGTTVPVTLTGTNFVAGATTVAVSGANVTVSNIVVGSGTTLTADVTIAAGAALGARNVTVTTAGGTSGAQTFTVNPPAPTLTNITPNAGDRATTVPVTLTGTNFVAGATVAVSGGGVTVANIVVGSSTSLTADFTIDGTTSLGARNVTVTTAGGTSTAQTFTIEQPDGTEEFTATGMTTFIVPAGVTSITIDAYGALGGSGSTHSNGPNPGGLGARALATTVAVTPGEALTVTVGGRGGDAVYLSASGSGGVNGGGVGGAASGGGNGGGGGGMSEVRRGATALVVAAGGGGGGGDNPGALGGAGGETGSPGADGGDGIGGFGSGFGGGAGGGGTATAAGAGGLAQVGTGDGNAGAANQGGAGGSRSAGGGGGGAGVFGGGGGGGSTSGSAAGGGGGSSMGPAGTAFTTGANAGNAGNGRIVITW